MQPDPIQLATAFCHHDFRSAAPYFAEHIQWELIGAETVVGKEAVIAYCQQSADYLTSVKTEFLQFEIVATADRVVVDSLAEYTDANQEVTRVASCDLFRFADGLLTEIKSYTLDVSENA